MQRLLIGGALGAALLGIFVSTPVSAGWYGHHHHGWYLFQASASVGAL